MLYLSPPTKSACLVLWTTHPFLISLLLPLLTQRAYAPRGGETTRCVVCCCCRRLVSTRGSDFKTNTETADAISEHTFALHDMRANITFFQLYSSMNLGEISSPCVTFDIIHVQCQIFTGFQAFKKISPTIWVKNLNNYFKCFHIISIWTY